MTVIVTNVSFTLHTDVPETHSQTHPSGVLYACKPISPTDPNTTKQDVFVWIADVTFIQAALNRLMEQGYDADNSSFIPYSSKANWSAAYPFIAPSLECDAKGVVSVNMYQTAAVGSPEDSKPAASNDKKRKRSGMRLFKDAVLTNDLRDELHIQMYKYFQWLLAISTDMDATVNGKRCLNESKLSVLGVQSILSAMESTLPVVKSIPGESESFGSTYPFLEDVLQDQLGELADLRTRKAEPVILQGQWYNFDDMFAKLQAFKSKNGHCNVPKKYKEDARLGAWVNSLRQQKSKLAKQGLEYEDPGNRKLTSRTLVKERIDMLEDLGFEWVRIQQRATWEEHFDNMVEYYQTHGKWPSKNLGRLGEWTTYQRKLYHSRDKKFMETRYQKLQDINFDWDPSGKKAHSEISWDDGLAKLVAFKEAHGTFSVPSSSDDTKTDRFYKWVHSLHSEYRILQNGETMRLKYLNNERVSVLAEIGFKFQSLP